MVHYFSVSYDTIDVSHIENIQKHLMKGKLMNAWIH